MLWRLCVVAISAALLVAARAGSSAVPRGRSELSVRGDGFVVVVNEQNALPSAPRALVSRLFLKKVSRWDSGALVLPVDLPPDSPVRDAFTRRVLSKSVSSVKAYWQQQIFSGRDVPPPERPNDAAVLEFVQSNPAAIAYVSPLVTLPGGVRVLSVTD